MLWREVRAEVRSLSRSMDACSERLAQIEGRLDAPISNSA